MEKYFDKFVEEAELFFIKKMLSGPALKNKYMFCLDIIFNITKDPERDYSRGIIAYNPKYGQGKSFFFEVVFHRHKRLFGKNLFKMTSSKELVEVYKEGGEAALNEFIQVRNLFIDDIGDEGAIKEFYHKGNKLNVIRHVILKRYEVWTKKGWRTFGTTNLTIEDIADNYDGRVADRLMQMVYFEEFKFLSEGSFRQTTKTRKLTTEEVKQSWEKVKVPEKIERVDTTRYLNELLLEEEDYLNSMGDFNWGFVKKQLLERGTITQALFDKIDEDTLSSARSWLKVHIKESVRITMGNATISLQSREHEKRVNAITAEDVRNVAENIIVKKFFLELKQNENFKFDENNSNN